MLAWRDTTRATGIVILVECGVKSTQIQPKIELDQLGGLSGKEEKANTVPVAKMSYGARRLEASDAKRVKYSK